MRKNLQENFYKRLKQLGGVTTSNNPSTSLSLSTLIDYQRANDGIALGIVKESHNYFIKKTNKQDEKLGVEDFAYIGGVENKFKYQYSSLAEAEKNRNFYIKTLNESSAKQFKKIVINEDIANNQSNGDAGKPEKAQAEADKVKAGTKLTDTAPEKEPGAVPSAKEISVEKKQATAKVVDDTKSSSKKAIVTNKQATAKVVKEGFDKAPFPPSEDGAAAAPAVPAGDPTADAGMGGGDENSELDAAASALDDLGAGDGGAEAGAEPSLDGAADGAIGGADDAGLDGGIPTDGEGAIKDIEKLTGKLTQKIRSTDLTPEMTKGFLKSFITSFEDKLSNLEHEDRKELATAILKDKADDEMGIGNDVTSTDDSEEKEIEETINAHLAEMGLAESDVNIEGSAESSDDKPFKEYVKSRGYNPENINEISLMEMVSLVNGYTNECGETDKFDAQGLAEFVTPEISDKIQEAGNSLFENLMKPFGEKIKKNKKAYATEAVIPSINENFGEEDDDNGSDDDSSAPADDAGSDDSGAEVIATATADDTSNPADSISAGEEPIAVEKSMAIAPAGQVIAAGAPGVDSGAAAKTVTLDLNNNTISVSMNESISSKLEKIVNKKIEEQLSGKKSPINEGKKSELSIMIDKLVNEAIQKRRDAIEKRLLKK
jgi:hypothetical protein